MSERTGLPDVRRWGWLAALVVLALAVPAYLLASAGPALTDDQERAREAAAELPELEVGETAALADDESASGPGVAVDVATPGATVTVRATAPDGSGGGRRAGGGARVVTVTWDVLYRYDPTVPLDQAAVLGDVPSLEIGLRSDGEDVDLAGTGDTSVPGIVTGLAEPTGGGVVVAVAEDADDLALDVTFDGVAQTVDLLSGELDAGRAAGLYDTSRTGFVPERCTLLAAAPEGLDLDAWCAVDAIALTAWTAGTGWVEDADDRWALVRATAFVDSYATLRDAAGFEEAFLERVSSSLVLTLDGEAPVAGPEAPGGLDYVGAPGGPSEVSVFAVPAGTTPQELRLVGEITAVDDDAAVEPLVVAVDETLEVRGG